MTTPSSSSSAERRRRQEYRQRATATWLADNDYETLLVTTDPAPNLSDIFDQVIGHEVTEIEGIENLSAIEIDPDTAAEEYRQETIEPMRQLLGDDEIETVEEQLNSPCVEEIAAFDNFVDFMDSPEYDVVVFDTAPTGHTIRLMELPPTGTPNSRRAARRASALPPRWRTKKVQYERAIDTLQDTEQTTFAFVGKPEDSSIDEVERSAGDLAELGIESQLLIPTATCPSRCVKTPSSRGNARTNRPSSSAPAKSSTPMRPGRTRSSPARSPGSTCCPTSPASLRRRGSDRRRRLGNGYRDRPVGRRRGVGRSGIGRRPSDAERRRDAVSVLHRERRRRQEHHRRGPATKLAEAGDETPVVTWTRRPTGDIFGEPVGPRPDRR